MLSYNLCCPQVKKKKQFYQQLAFYDEHCSWAIWQTTFTFLLPFYPKLWRNNWYFVQAPGVQVAPASSSFMKCDGFAECQWPLGPRAKLQCLFLQRECQCIVRAAWTVGLRLKCTEWLFWCPSPLHWNLSFSLTSWLHYLLISSLQKCSARSEKPLKSSAVSTPPLPLVSLTCCCLLLHFLLVSLQSFSSLCQSCMPITSEPTCAEQVIPFTGDSRTGRKGEKCREGHRGGELESSWSSAVRFRLTWMLKPQRR